jgi:hypothetical protein
MPDLTVYTAMILDFYLNIPNSYQIEVFYKYPIEEIVLGVYFTIASASLRILILLERHITVIPHLFAFPNNTLKNI